MSEQKQKETFEITAKQEDGSTKVTEYAVLTPNTDHGQQAMNVYNKTLGLALQNGGLLRQRLVGYMREQGLWGDEQDAAQKELGKKLNALELKLAKGGIKLSEARNEALEMRRLRMELRELFAKRNELDTNTVEGQAENARFNALVAQCLVYNDSGDPVYSSLEAYLNDSASEVAFTGAQTLANMMYEIDKNHEMSLPENKFLKKWKFVDEELRLVNSDGKLVDTEGRLINEDGRFVNEDGKLVDIKGNVVDDDGNYVPEETSPFLDDDGNPVEEETEATPEEDDEDTEVATSN
jgi:hypothetical protein